MALDLGTLTVKIGADIAGLKKGMAAAKSAMDGLNGLGLAAAAGLAAWGASAYKAVQAAAVMEDTVSAAGVVFGEMGDDVKKWAKEIAGAVGRSEKQMLEFAVGLQAVLDPLTGNRKAAAEMSTSMAKLAVDLASFYPGKSDVDAVHALKAALAGEAEPMKQFGVVINEAALAHQALAAGITKPVAALTASEKAMLTYQLILEKTKNAHGDAARTSDGFANQMKRLEASFDDLTVATGQRLMPVAQTLLKWIQDAITWWGELDPKLSKAAMSIGGIALVSMGVVAAFSAIYSVMAPIVAGMGALVSGAFALGKALATPLLIIGGLLAALGVLKKYFGIGLTEIAKAIGKFAESSWGMVKSLAKSIADGLSQAWEFVGSVVEDVWSGIKDTIKGAVLYVADLVESIPDKLGKWIPGLEKAKDIAKSMKEYLEGGPSGAAPKEKKKFSGKDFEEGLFSQVKSFLSSGDFKVLEPLKEAVTLGAGDVLSSLKNMASSFGVTDMQSLFSKLGIEGISDWKDIIGKLGDGAADMLKTLMDSLGLEFGGLGKITKKAKDELGRLDGTAGEVGKALAASSTAVRTWAGALQGVGVGVAQKMAGQLDGIGGTLSKAIQDLIDGKAVDWIQTAISAVVELFAHSTAFQELLRYLNEFMLTLAETLGDLVAGILPVVKVALDLVASLLPLVGVIGQLLAPVFRFLTDILRGIGGVLQVLIGALMPILNIIGGVLGPIFKSLTDALMPLLEIIAMLVTVVLAPLQPVLWVLAKLLEVLGAAIGFIVGVLAAVIKFIVDGIIGVYNWIVDRIADFVSMFNGAWAAEIRNAKITNTSFADAMNAATTATYDSVTATYEAAKADRKAADAANKANEALTNVPSGYKAALRRYQSMTAEASSVPRKTPRGGGEGRSARRFAKGGVVQSPTFAMIGERGAEAVVPLSGSSTGAGLDGLGGGGGGVVIQNLTIMANDPKQFLRELEALQRRKAWTRNGSPVTGSPRFSSSG